MRLHTDVLDYGRVARATEGMTGVYATVSEHGSRTHARAFEVSLEGNGYLKNTGQYGAGRDHGATWDEWGIFMARLYRIDPDAVWGTVNHPTYESAEHFHWTTGGRFHDLKHDPNPANRRHRWGYASSVATGSYRVVKCEHQGCSAIMRSMARGYAFADIAS